MEKQKGATIPSHTYVSDRDPNNQKNRIPTQSELSGLKDLAGTLSRSVQNLKEEINRAQETHATLLAKYQEQFQELEGTQSQLHESKRILKLLQGQSIALEKESNRVSGITHPIRRYPSDVLQSIFEFACGPDEIDNAIQLSHVCQRWRAIILETPRVWSSFTFTLRKKKWNTWFFWACIISRMKHVPASIDLQQLDTEGATQLKPCNLARIPKIGGLYLSLPGSEYFNQICTLPPFLPKEGVKKLHISGVWSGDQPKVTPDITWEVGPLMEALPPVSYLSLEAGCSLLVTPSSSSYHVTNLYLRYLVNVDVMSVFSEFKQLLDVQLYDLGIAADIPQQAVSLPLHRLHVSYCDGEYDWLKNLSCPNLEVFSHDGADWSDPCVSFVNRHNSISSLSLPGGDEMVATVVKVAPQIRSLDIEPNLSYFHKRKVARFKGPPFPNLERLIINDLARSMSSEDFEGVVRTRCLPRSDPQSKIPNSLHPLHALVIRIDPEVECDITREPWRATDLFRAANQHVSRDPMWPNYELLTLTWNPHTTL